MNPFKIPDFFIKILSTSFYVGYLPLIPGTFGSLVGVFLFYLSRGSNFTYVLFTLGFIILGFLISGKAEKIFNKKDARCIVIDEITGMLLSLIFMPYDLRLMIFAFIIFRLLDALKPYPAARLQNLSGSLGIMCDDIIAGLYTNIALQVVLRFASFRTS